MTKTRISSTLLTSSMFVLSVLLFPPAGKCQNSVQTGDLNSLVERAKDARLTMRERMEAFSQICTLSPEEQTHGLRALIRDADETVAAAAFAALVQRGDPDLGDSSLQSLGSWSAGNQRIVLQSILDEATRKTSPELTSISRGFLQSCISAKRFHCESRTEPQPIDFAALALAYHGEHSDAALLEQAVQVYPGSHGIWLALAQLQHDKSTRKLAQSVYREGGNSMLLRICAAASIASDDERAATFVCNAIREFLAAYSDKQVEEFFPTPGVDRGATQAYYQYRSELRMIGVLRFLDVPSVQDMVFEQIQSKNEQIRTITRLIAAMRWPDRLLMEAPTLGIKGKADLLAVLAAHHPSLEQRTREAAPVEDLQKSTEALRKAGLRGLFGLAGTIVSCP